MTRLRLAVLIAFVFVAGSTVAQLHEGGDPDMGRRGGCADWLCYDVNEPVDCWAIGEPTGVSASECEVICDLGSCWCAYRGRCYSI